jgi:RNA polymerase sigma-70 factor (family 1)
MMEDPTVLMSAFREGDAAAFMRIFQQYNRSLLYFAQKMIRQKEGAEELVSDCLIRLWQRRSNFESEEKIKAFLYISVKNACLNYIKSPHARQQFQAEPAEDLLSEPPEVVAKMIQAELLDAIYREIENLPEKQRAVFRMSHLDGMSTEEICAALNMSPAAVFTNRSRATETLKKLFKDKNLLLYWWFLQWLGD